MDVYAYLSWEAGPVGVCGELSFWGAVESVTLIPQWDMMQLITIIWVGSLMIKSKQGAVRFEKYMTQFQS